MNVVQILFTTILPWIELRGAIPLAVASSFESYVPLIILVNILLFFPVWIGLEIFYKHLNRWSFIRRIVNRIHDKGKRYVNNYGPIGIAIFVAIPLPGSGVYSGTLLAWLLGLEWKKSFIACSLGVLTAGILVYLMSTGALLIFNNL
ncbi:MAG: ligand-binding protein SH3 [Candidatus Aenigmatarchaeota archaeon]|nr:small multi-drug export protein [Candidatus Aenigmarchaeota archaeon]RLJ04375.1 MAG: ligand-binding protein SH3 [Candidatus Aenigmarchaeota archaeon]